MSYSFLDLAYDILKQAGQPMIYQEIWQAGHDKELTAKLETAGKGRMICKFWANL